jgi:hypothetical protein
MLVIPFRLKFPEKFIPMIILPSTRVVQLNRIAFKSNILFTAHCLEAEFGRSLMLHSVAKEADSFVSKSKGVKEHN